MKILAIDTTTKFLTLAVYDNGRIAEYNLETGNKLSSLLVPAIKKSLEAFGLRLQDIDYFAAGIGPGSFTGIRLGLSVIKGFSFALGKPLVGIVTLDALAMNAPSGDKRIITAIDAKRDLVYSAAYRCKKGELSRITPYALLNKRDFYRSIKPSSIILGDILNLYRDEIKNNFSGASFLDRDLWYPKAHNIITLALKKIKQGKSGNNYRISPVYLYPKECQIRKSVTNKKGS